MYLKRCFFAFFSSVLLVAGLTAPAQAQTTAPAVTAGSSSSSGQNTGQSTGAGQNNNAGQGLLRGHVSDPTGALIPGASITVTTATGTTVGSTTSDPAGAFVVRGLDGGSYVVQVTSDGFAQFVSTPISLAAGQSKNVEIKMVVEGAQQEVEVTEEGGPQVSVEAGANSDSVVIKGKDLDALSDDPDELQNELSALAGPAAGPNGGQIYIDGFTAGELPPKSAIREIRINQNPFSAEFDRLGYGRIEILTKPGTDKLHGRGFVQGNDNAFNTGNPFAANLPPYHSIQYNGTVSGAINKNASFFFSAEARNNQSETIYSAENAVLSGTTYVKQNISGGLFTPSTHIEISPRIDLQFGEKNTLTMRYQFADNSSTGFPGGGGGGFGGGGGASFALPTEATSNSSIEHTFQISDSEVVNDHMVNETRFQYLLDLSTVSPAQSSSILLPQVSVPGSVTAGGPTGQNQNDTTQHFELQNLTTISKGAQAIKFGTRIRDNHDSNISDSSFNGSFSFPSLAAYINTLNGVSGYGPIKLTYATGAEAAVGNVLDAALFFQDDWKANRYLTLSGGVRWETQNHISDHNDWAPRVAFAYALDGHKKGGVSKTVLRGGYGFFFDRLGIGPLMSAERYNGKPGSQEQFVINNPTCFSATSLSAALGPSGSGCGTATVSPDIISPAYRSPTHQQLGVSLERQLTKTMTLTTTYLNTLGVHQNATIDANAYLPNPGTAYYNSTTGPTPGVRPHPQFGPINETYPEAIYKQNQVIFSLNARLSAKLNVNGNFNLNWANSDTGTASNTYDISQDYGPATFTSRQQMFLLASYTGPWGITFNPMMVAQAGRPYDVATALDLTGDNFIGQDRPGLVTSNSLAANEVVTNYGTFDLSPTATSPIIPANLGRGPAAVAVNLRVARTWGLGPEIGSSARPRPGRGGGPGGPPGGFGGIGGPGGGGGGRGGGGGGFGGPGGGMGGTGRKYSLNFSAQALNLFNDVDYGTPVGTVTQANPGSTQVSSRFGTSTNLAGGIFSTGSAARRVFFQLAFQF